MCEKSTDNKHEVMTKAHMSYEYCGYIGEKKIFRNSFYVLYYKNNSVKNDNKN
jgi:hypothetical protein